MAGLRSGREVIRQERAPRLRRWPSAAAHVLADGGLANVNTEFEQLTVDAWRAPQRVLLAHSSDQLTEVMRNGWSSWSAVTALPRPEQPEGIAMPRDDGGWLDDDERGSPLGPDVTEPRPEEPIRCGQLRSLHRALKDAHLMTERHDLELQRCAAAERQHEGCENGGEYAAE